MVSIDTLILVVLGSILLLFLRSFFKKKAENLATKQDITEITQKIEEVKAIHNKQLETFKSSLELSNQLRLVSLEKRLECYQKAYEYLTQIYEKLVNKETEPNLKYFIDECKKWYNSHCLYLDSRSKKYFRISLLYSSDYYQADDGSQTKVRNHILDSLKIITTEIGLPWLKEEELELLDRKK